METITHYNLYNYDTLDLERLCQKLAVSSQHAKTILSYLYKNDQDITQINEHVLPKKLKLHLNKNLTHELPKIKKTYVSQYDHSVKFIVELADGQLIEAVLMPEKTRLTLCISSQVGCARACSFCYTGRMGLKRNLNVSEIIGQVILANRWAKTQPEWANNLSIKNPTITNIVFMGMGEPLDNFDSLSKSINLLIHPLGLAIAPRKISVSTAGHVEGLRKLRKIYPQIPIAISLHATTESLRRKIMPITKEWPLEEVMKFIREQDSNKLPLIQYTLIAGVNDREVDAQGLVKLFKGMNIKINLIPFNDVSPSRFTSPAPKAIQTFRDILHAEGVRSLIRYSKGQDINAACGQLVNSAATT